MCTLPLDPPWRGPERTFKVGITLLLTRSGGSVLTTVDLSPLLPSLPDCWVWVIVGVVRPVIPTASPSPLRLWDRPDAMIPFHRSDSTIAVQSSTIWPVWVPLSPERKYQKIQYSLQAANTADQELWLMCEAHRTGEEHE